MIQNENLVDLIDLHIPATTETPEVKCSKELGEIVMIGNLIPSDPKSFFAPILRWFNVYTVEYNPLNITVHFYLTFVNGCSDITLDHCLKTLKIFTPGIKMS
jgi:hypothetical protein